LLIINFADIFLLVFAYKLINSVFFYCCVLLYAKIILCDTCGVRGYPRLFYNTLMIYGNT